MNRLQLTQHKRRHKMLKNIILIALGLNFAVYKDSYAQSLGKYPKFDFYLPIFVEVNVSKSLTLGSVDGSDNSIIQGDFVSGKSVFFTYREEGIGRFHGCFSVLAGYQRMMPFYVDERGVEGEYQYDAVIRKSDKFLLGGNFRLEGWFSSSTTKLYADYFLFFPVYSESGNEFLYDGNYLTGNFSENYNFLNAFSIGVRKTIPINNEYLEDGSDSYIGFVAKYNVVFNAGLIYFLSKNQHSFGVVFSIGILFPS